MDDFCAHQVEAIGKEADHVQIAALSSCLKVSLTPPPSAVETWQGAKKGRKEGFT
jgi:hypothetical protein